MAQHDRLERNPMHSLCLRACHGGLSACDGKHKPGEVSERLKEHAWKVCIRSKAVSRVRIPPSPPSLMCASGSFCDAVGSQRSREGENPRGSTQASGTPADAAGSPALARGVRRRMRRAIPPSPPSLMCASGSFCDAVGSQQSREGENPRGSTQASGTPADAAGSPALARGVRRRMRRAIHPSPPSLARVSGSSRDTVGSQQSREGENPRGSTQASGAGVSPHLSAGHQ